MNPPPPAPPAGSSTRPYLIRALHDWCTDNGFTPYIAVYVDASVQVPMEYVKNHEIVLNVSFDATSGLRLGNDFIEFRARFGGVARDIVVPVDHVIAIYARENGQGMAFPIPSEPPESSAEEGVPETAAHSPSPLKLAPSPAEGEPQAPSPGPAGGEEDAPSPPPPGGGRPALKRIK
ncbi:ClpXP protease specificity-enhancing factor [Caldimonas aquatica]|uniref:ClpXP protease specificity-enhancing factor n=1 Tax=Caldimonas aquatica TaxID=376175 RepID=A0ABY6MTT9_9BURK|nr:ClpXP protease specificity-enhancing factor [Schlegelella aquatica]UZD55427.1 ClpXP protease specificity-enhancing factor [Schlegelella aquatica]